MFLTCCSDTWLSFQVFWACNRTKDCFFFVFHDFSPHCYVDIFSRSNTHAQVEDASTITVTRRACTIIQFYNGFFNVLVPKKKKIQKEKLNKRIEQKSHLYVCVFFLSQYMVGGINSEVKTVLFRSFFLYHSFGCLFLCKNRMGAQR